MNKKMLGVLAVSGVSLFLTAAGAGAQEFSADMVNREGKEITNSKIYVTSEKVRMEMAEGVMIIRRDKNLSWMLMPADKMYMEQAIDLSRAPRTSSEFDDEVSREALGTEVVDGAPAQKFKVVYKEKKKDVTVYQWLRGQFPVKVEAVDGSWGFEYKNLQTGAQPADLFEPPADYTKFAMPSLGDMMKGMGGF